MDPHDITRMQIKDLLDLTADAPVVVGPDATANAIAQQLTNSASDAVLVIDPGTPEAVDGVITKTDLVTTLGSGQPAPTAATMANDRPLTFVETTPLEQIVAELGTNSLVVVTDTAAGNPIAVVRRDVLAGRLADRARRLA